MMNFHSCILFALACAPLAAPQDDEYSWDCPAEGYLPFRREMLVSTEALAGLRDDPGLVILHVGEESDYARGHIPGARLLPLDSVAALPSSARTVVLYDGGLGLEAARAYVLLDRIGRAGRVALLDGHLAQWMAEGRAVSTGAGETAPSLKAEPPPSGDGEPAPSAVLLDVRGEDESREPIAGARRLPWSENLVDLERPRLKSEAQLRRLYRAIPARPDQEIVLVGREACFGYFVAKLLGYAARPPEPLGTE